MNTTVLPKDMWEKIVASLPPPPPKLLQMFFIKFTYTSDAEISPSRAISPDELALIRWFKDYNPEKELPSCMVSATTYPEQRGWKCHFADRFLKDAMMLGYDFMSPADRSTWKEYADLEEQECVFFMSKRPL